MVSADIQKDNWARAAAVEPIVYTIIPLGYQNLKRKAIFWKHTSAQLKPELAAGARNTRTAKGAHASDAPFRNDGYGYGSRVREIALGKTECEAE